MTCRVKVELTDEDFDEAHEEMVLRDSVVEIRQRDSVLVYLKIRVNIDSLTRRYDLTEISIYGLIDRFIERGFRQIRRLDNGVGRISTVVLPAKLSGSMLTRDEEDDDEEDDDEDDNVEKLYETDANFYSTVSGG